MISKNVLKQTLLSVLKVGSSVGSDVFLGQDEIVSLVSTILDTYAFLNTLNMLRKNKDLKKIFSIQFTSPEQVHEDTLKLLSENEEMYSLCKSLTPLLNEMAPIIGDWISVFLPDTAGVVGTTIQFIITQGGSSSYDKLTYLYNQLPESSQRYFVDKNALTE